MPDKGEGLIVVRSPMDGEKELFMGHGRLQRGTVNGGW
jgi:hypothetical protein